MSDLPFSLDTYAVFGNPIGHSKSPRIHAAFARQTGQNLEYTAQLVPLDDFAQAVQAFQRRGGKGLNVTVPFKQEAWQLAAQRSTRAEKAGAVNTLYFSTCGACIGDNTDGAGLVRDIVHNHGFPLAQREVLILGAGGAVRGVLEPLLVQGPARIVIANRTVRKAEELAELFAPEVIRGCAYEALAGERFDVIVNGTSAGLHGDLPALPDGLLEPGGLAYDMVYADAPTVFVCWALEHGAGIAVDGLGMLVEQAAESFYIWRGIRPDTAPVIRKLRP